jgi:DNA-binding Lrp family transcriptional regulator
MASRFSVSWTFLTHHGQVLLCIARDPGMRLVDIGEQIGISEATARRIVDELADAGYIARERTSPGGRYTVNAHLPLPDPVARDRNVGVLVDVLVGPHVAREPADRRE